MNNAVPVAYSHAGMDCSVRIDAVQYTPSPD